MTRDEAFNMFRRLRDELDAGRFALSRVLVEWNSNPGLSLAAKANGVTDTELRRCAKTLETTFVLRLFAEFEAVLRDYWEHGAGRNTEPDMRPLMDSIAQRRRMSSDHLAEAHDLRNYRNLLIHEDARAAKFDFPQSLRAVGRYMSWLPLKW